MGVIKENIKSLDYSSCGSCGDGFRLKVAAQPHVYLVPNPQTPNPKNP